MEIKIGFLNRNVLGAKRTSKASAILLLFLISASPLAILGSTSNIVKAQTPTHGVVSIAFDDNYKDQFDNAFPLMQARGIVGTFYAVSNQIRDFSGDPSYMNISELQELQASGNEIGSHSVTHSEFIYLSDDEIRDECSTSKQVLELNGLSVTNFAYPDGVTNDHVDSIVREYYRSGRTAYVTPYLMGLPASQFRVAGFSSEGDTNELQSLKDMVDQAYANNSWVIILFHHIKPNDYSSDYTTTTQDFASFLDYTINKGTQILTVNQTLNLTPLSMSTNFGTVTPTSGLYAQGSTFSIQAFSPSVVEGERYVWNGWTGTGSGSYSGTSNPATITMNGSVTEAASWTHEYKLTITSNFGTTSPSVGEYWYAAGSTVTIAASPPTAGADENYTWLGWNGSGSGSYSGTNNQTVITMNGSITESASWEHQYKLTLSSNSGTTTPSTGQHWYQAGSQVTITASPPNLPADTRGVWAGWTGSGASSYNGTNNPLILTMNGPVTEAASWTTEYKLNIATNLGTTSPSVGDHWYEAGTSVNVTTSPPPADAGVQYVCSGWSGTGSVPATGNASSMAFTINAPSNITWTWKTQYYLTVSSAHGTAGGAGWYDAGTSAYATVSPTTVDGTAGIQYVFNGWSGGASGSSSPSNSIVMDAPKTAIADWSTRNPPTSTPTPTSSNTATPAPSPTASPSPSPSSTVSPSPSASPSSTPTQTPNGSNDSVNIYLLYGAVITVVLVGAIVGLLAFRKFKH